MNDQELQLLRRRKLVEMKKYLEKRLKTEKEGRDNQEINSEEILNRFFIDRAWEVMNAARSQYPQVAGRVENALVEAILNGKIKAKITGEELYGLFLRIGFKVHLETRINILEHGKLKSLEEKVREKTLE